MALSLSTGACSTGVPTIATNFTVADVELIKENAIRVWFTQPPLLGTGKANDVATYSISGPLGLTLAAATSTSFSDKAIDIVFHGDLSIGQWTLAFVSANLEYNSIHLPSNTTYVFEIVNLTQESPGLETSNNLTRKFINPAFWEKTNWEALITGLEVGREALDDTAQKAFKQSYLSTATGKYLSIRASNSGINKPVALGLTDEKFRELAISVLNRKLTEVANLELLEILYGAESTRANLTSIKTEPFSLFDKASVTFNIDGVTIPIILDWTSFNNASRATALEISQALNVWFQKLNSKAFAVPFYNHHTGLTHVRVFSGTIGLRSSIAAVSGTALPLLNFGGSLFTTFPNDY
jgi:hypothetical protein